MKTQFRLILVTRKGSVLVLNLSVNYQVLITKNIPVFMLHLLTVGFS